MSEVILNRLSGFSIGKADPVSLVFFAIIISLTLIVTYFAARRTKSASEFYAAGRSVTGFQNGLALAGDYLSAASFLGISGMVALQGYDGAIYAVGWMVGWPALMFLIAEPFRNLGKYTLADIVSLRLKKAPIRLSLASAGLLVTLCYTIAQMVGAGKLIQLMFGIPYELAEILVGGVMLLYVLFGGMLATTWVQIIKAVLLLIGVTILAFLVMLYFGFSFSKLFGAVTETYGFENMFKPGGLVTNPLDALSLGLALMFGLLGLPHVLMKFFTVPDAKTARKSVAYGSTFIGYFYLVIPIVGFGAAAIVGKEFITGIDKGGNMAAPILSMALGGNIFLGFLAAVAFATILAVVAGLTLAASSAMSHDIYVGVFKKGQATEAEQVKVARYSTVGFGILAVLLGILFKNQNVAFLVGLAFAIAASSNFPALLLSITWKGLSTKGAVWSIIVGAATAGVLIVLSPTIWVSILGFEEAIFPLKNPGLFSITAAFIAAYIGSKISPDKEAAEKFEQEKVRTYLGVGAE